MIRVLSQSCAATGSFLGMHTEQMFVLLKYGTTEPLRRVIQEVVDDQLIIANANSEVGIGGDVMRSNTALTPDGDGWLFDKQALAASYSQHSDLILSTARRAPDAAETDQKLCLLRTRDFTLEPTSGWDTLGLRGTCSSGMHITGRVTDGRPLPRAVRRHRQWRRWPTAPRSHDLGLDRPGRGRHGGGPRGGSRGRAKEHRHDAAVSGAVGRDHGHVQTARSMLAEPARHRGRHRRGTRSMTSDWS